MGGFYVDAEPSKLKTGSKQYFMLFLDKYVQAIPNIG